MQCGEYHHWQKYKDLDLDRATLRCLRDGIAGLVAEYDRLRGEMTTDEQRHTWDEAFATDTADLNVALTEIKTKLEGC